MTEVAGISTDMDDVLALLGHSAADWLAGPTASARPRGSLGAVRPVDRALRREMAGLGWIGLALPETLGGVGLGASEALVLSEAFGRHAFPEPFIATAVMPEFLLAAAGAGSGADKLAALHMESERWLSMAWQERAGEIGGVGGMPPQTRLEGQRLSGSKCFVPAVEGDTVLLVSALQGNEAVVVAVDAAEPGVAVEPLAAGDGVSLARIRFDRVAIRSEGAFLRGGAADAAVSRALAAGTLASAAHLAGLASACLDKTVAYVNGRRQFGRAIGSFQSVQHRLVDLYTANRLAGASWRHALHAFNSAAPDAQRAVSAAKARCADAALNAGRTAVQLHGAMGFTDEADIGLYLRAAMFHAAWLGNATQHRRRFAAGLAPEALARV
jgi:alkylation response protein AidB-like acyl-CoA dehydrogenase